MLNKQYSTPLHGVDLFNTEKTSQQHASNSLPYGLTIEEGLVHVNSEHTLLWQLTDSGTRYQTQLNIYQYTNNSYVLEVQCEGTGYFLISPNKITIDWRSGTSSEHYFQTLAIVLWLELQHVCCIHANALVKNNQAIAIIGPSGMGKSTLSAYLQSQGYTWLTDDMLAIHNAPSFPSGPNASLSFPRKREPASSFPRTREPEYVVYPSWPNARMWPDSVQNVTNLDASALNKVHENFNKVSVPMQASSPLASYELAGIYVLNRRGAELAVMNKNAKLKQKNNGYEFTESKQGNVVSLATINSSQALMALIQNSMLGNAYSKLHVNGKSLEQTRLLALIKLVNALPIKQIHYPNSYDSLPNIQELIESDVIPANRNVIPAKAGTSQKRDVIPANKDVIPAKAGTSQKSAVIPAKAGNPKNNNVIPAKAGNPKKPSQ